MIVLLFIFFCIRYISYQLHKRLFPAPNIDPTGKYVLISGCDSGFGHGLATELDKQGFNVLAAVLLPETVKTLKEQLSDKATVFQLDITNQNDIDAAYELIKKKTNVLHALVNNAGIGTGGYIDWISMENIRRMMDVNFFGHVAMTKKFLPLLIAKKDSRVVNICSVMGFIALPGMSAYSASKYAFESFSDCLRREMFPWNLRVSIVEPGWMRTGIIRGHDRLLKDLWKEVSPSVQKRWGNQFVDDLIEVSVTKNPFINYAQDPNKIIRALQHAVMSTEPQLRYRPDLQGKLIFFPISLIPAWIVDRLIETFTGTSHLPAGISSQIKDQ